jgi:hypothetical protein
LRDGNAVALPRKFQLSENGLALIAQLAGIERFRQISEHPQAERMVTLDPLEFGKPWRIGSAPVSAIFYLEPNFGAQSDVRCCAKIDMIRRVMPHCAPPASRRRDWLAELCAAVDRADTYIVELGDLETASAAIAERLAASDPR